MTNPYPPQQDDALIIVDVQNDFLPGGALAVPEGDTVIPVINRYIDLFLLAKRPVFASRDWHPTDHCSFQAQGGPWPLHCVAGTSGANFAAALQLPAETTVISKANIRDKDAYSAFEDTDLDQLLKQQSIKRLFVGGLATDYCVLNTVKDALAKNYAVLLLKDAIRAVNVKPDDGRRAEQQMEALGAQAITLKQLT